MIEEPLGIYYLDYAKEFVQASQRKMIVGWSKSSILKEMVEYNIQPNWFCWLSECRTPGFLIVGNAELVIKWIELHMPEKFGEPLRNL